LKKYNKGLIVSKLMEEKKEEEERLQNNWEYSASDQPSKHLVHQFQITPNSDYHPQ